MVSTCCGTFVLLGPNLLRSDFLERRFISDQDNSLAFCLAFVSVMQTLASLGIARVVGGAVWFWVLIVAATWLAYVWSCSVGWSLWTVASLSLPL